MANVNSIMSLLYPELLANILTNQQTAKKSEFSAFSSQLQCLAELFARLQNQTSQPSHEPHVHFNTFRPLAPDPKFASLESFLEQTFTQQIPTEMRFGQAYKRPRSPFQARSQTTPKLALLSKKGAFMEGGTHVSMTPRNSAVVDGVNLDEIREFARHFKMKRISLGLTQTQVGQALSATEGPAYSQSAICRFEKLDITPKSAQRIKPVLEKWLTEAEERCKQGNSHGTESSSAENSRKRKRRTSFNPQALEILNDYFERNPHPTGWYFLH
ncbi:POU [Cichlidogyrus casuarinus]|uniref:POU n=1 Tax=Cichlidogyrus casuarinus TaxID=1844966 RepID=A0ABD2PQT5_9PLAT